MKLVRYAGAFVSGALVVYLLGISAALAVTVMSDMSQSASFVIGAKPLVVYEFTRTADSLGFSVGSGLLFIAAVGGLANCVLVEVLRQRLGEPTVSASE